MPEATMVSGVGKLGLQREADDDELYRTAKRQVTRMSLLANIILEFRLMFGNLIEI